MGYFRLKGYKDDQGLQENKRGQKGLQEVTRGNRGLQGNTGGYKGLFSKLRTENNLFML